MQTVIDILTTHRDMLPEGASCNINAEADPEHAHGMSAGDEYYRRSSAPEQVGDDVEARGQAVSIHCGDRVLIQEGRGAGLPRYLGREGDRQRVHLHHHR